MLTKSTNYIYLLLLFLTTYLALLSLKPNNVSVDDVIEGDFHIKNAFEHVRILSQQPHFVGAKGHAHAKSYVVEQLQELGLPVEVQKTNATSSRHAFAHIENVISKIEGSDKSAPALVLMSHYDSASPASFGAADAGSGVAVILEGVRAYLQQGITPKNDIIILITDGEEMGLLGASAFVNKHPWADNVGVVLNFEARGSAGASYMLMETNYGNRKLLEVYNKANLRYSLADSLAYSIYKSLPNDTDLTVFRVDKDIVGFNFAFIDDHFNYHTALDSAENLSLDSLASQAHYLMPMLATLSQMDLSTLQSDDDDVFFKVPYWKTLNYPFEWALILSLFNLVIFVAVVIIGVKKEVLNIRSIFIGSAPFLISTIGTAVIGWLLLTLFYWIHPQYSEIYQGFTYNGHAYILFFSLLAINLCYFTYRFFIKKHTAMTLLVVPTLLWIVIGLASAVLLTGAHFVILIGFAGTLLIAANVFTSKYNPTFTLLLLLMIVLVFFPFVQLPVALGVQLLPYSSMLLVMVLSVFIGCLLVQNTIQINKWLMIAPVVLSLIYAETGASVSQERPLPNSLFYFQDKDEQSAYWMTYDNNTDEWNQAYFTQERLSAGELTKFNKLNRYWARAISRTDNRHIPEAKIEVQLDQLRDGIRHYKFTVIPQRDVNFLNIINNQSIQLLKLAINNEVVYQGEGKKVQASAYLCGMIRTSESAFTLDIEIPANETLDLSLLEVSADLIEHNEFDVVSRPKAFIAKPFINSDSIVTKQKIPY